VGRAAGGRDVSRQAADSDRDGLAARTSWRNGAGKRSGDCGDGGVAGLHLASASLA